MHNDSTMKMDKNNALEDRIESGIYLEKYPYISLIRNGVNNNQNQKRIVIFPQSGDLFYSVKVNGVDQINLLKKFIPSDYSIYILGYDPNMPPEVTCESIADDFATIIKNHIGPSTIMAISFGGFIAIPFAAKYPELVTHLVLLITAYRISDRGYEWSIKQIELAKENKMFEVIKMQEQLYNNKIIRGIMRVADYIGFKRDADKMNPPSTFINAYSILREDKGVKREYLEKIKAPVVILGGTKDLVFSEEIYRETAELIPNAKLILFKGAGHMVPIEKMRKFKKTLIQELSNL